MKRKSIFLNGDFFLSGARPKRAQAIAIENGIIAEIGTNAQIKPLSQRGYRTYDLKKKFVLPAFTDAHLHLVSIGNHSKQVNLDGVDSLDKALKIIQKAVMKLKPGQWLKGRGWNKNLWGGEFPHKKHLDAVCDNPAILGSKDGHLGWVNSVALEACGINKDTGNPPGGVFEKDINGELTGIIKEKAYDIVIDKVPSLSYDEKINSILLAQKYLLKLGIVGVGDFDTWPTLISKLRELEKSGRLKLRVCKMIYENVLDEVIRLGFTTGKGGKHFRAGYLKLFSDGALGSQTAFMFRPYKGSKDNLGVETLTMEQFDKFVSKAVNAGISVAIHAIGDKANYISLGVFGKYAKQFAAFGLTPRIEHAQVLRKKEIGCFGKYGITASVQPIHLASDRDVADQYWGARSRYAFPFKSLLNSGAKLAFGSDAPIENADPIAGIHAAVTRKRVGESRPAWYPEEKISVLKAIEAYTIGSARACCFDNITGSIKVGKQADFIVLSDDIVKMKPSDIYKADVLATIVDGDFVYGRNNI